MPNLVAMSFEAELAPSFDLRCLQPNRTLPDGWGIGHYPAGGAQHGGSSTWAAGGETLDVAVEVTPLT